MCEIEGAAPILSQVAAVNMSELVHLFGGWAFIGSGIQVEGGSGLPHGA